MSSTPITTYTALSTVKDQIHPLDLIAFKASDPVSQIVATGQKLITGRDDFTHVGLVVTKELLDLPDLEPGQIYVWESTISINLPGVHGGQASLDTGKNEIGVQLRALAPLINNYLVDDQCQVAWCPLIDNPWNKFDTDTELYLSERRSDLSQKFTALYQQLKSVYYEMNPLVLLACLLKPLRKVRDILKMFLAHLPQVTQDHPNDWLFCSELVGYVYQELGILSLDYNREDILPIDLIFPVDQDGLPRLVQEKLTYFKPEKIKLNNPTLNGWSRSKAFLVGINYEGTSHALRGCLNDIESVKTFLEEVQGYSEILVLTDQTTYKPYRSHILDGFRWLLSDAPVSEFRPGRNYPPSNSQEKIKLYFHYSGHGAQIPDLDGDEKDGRDEVLIPLDVRRAGVISDDQLRRDLVAKVPASTHLTAVLDCCHSGTGMDLTWNCRFTGYGYSLIKQTQYKSLEGQVIMLSGCRDDQTAADLKLEGQFQGATTASLLKVLEQHNYQLNYGQLLYEIQTYIRKNRLSSQIPQLSTSHFIDLDQPVEF